MFSALIGRHDVLPGNAICPPLICSLPFSVFFLRPRGIPLTSLDFITFVKVLAAKT